MSESSALALLRLLEDDDNMATAIVAHRYFFCRVLAKLITKLPADDQDEMIVWLVDFSKALETLKDRDDVGSQFKIICLHTNLAADDLLNLARKART